MTSTLPPLAEAGTVASVALLLNGLFVLAIMAAFDGTLTLPGLAGLTLTLGMAVGAALAADAQRLVSDGSAFDIVVSLPHTTREWDEEQYQTH